MYVVFACHLHTHNQPGRCGAGVATASSFRQHRCMSAVEGCWPASNWEWCAVASASTFTPPQDGEAELEAAGHCACMGKKYQWVCGVSFGKCTDVACPACQRRWHSSHCEAPGLEPQTASRAAVVRTAHAAHAFLRKPCALTSTRDDADHHGETSNEAPALPASKDVAPNVPTRKATKHERTAALQVAPGRSAG